MNKKNIIEFLEDNDLSEIKEVKYKANAILLKFKYYFDNVELEAAKAYANDECEAIEKSEEWYEEFFLPYLNDFAVDNVEDIIEEYVEEEEEIEYEFIAYDLSKENYNYNEFIVVFYEEGEEIEIDDIIVDLA